MELQKKSKATSILHFQLCHDIPCKNEFIIFILQELLEDMVPEDTGDNADTNEDITDGHGNLATGWC